MFVQGTLITVFPPNEDKDIFVEFFLSPLSQLLRDLFGLTVWLRAWVCFQGFPETKDPRRITVSPQQRSPGDMGHVTPVYTCEHPPA